MKKHLLLTIFIFVFSSKINSQPQPWAQPGAHWYYKDGDDAAIGFSGYIEITKGSDTIINGIICDVLIPHHEGVTWWNGGQPYNVYYPNQYTYVSNDTVYHWRNNQFYVLYVLNAQPAEYWICGPDYYGSFCQGDTIRIDSAQIVNVNGINMRTLVPEPYNLFPQPQSMYHHHPVYERFGSLAFLFPIPMCITDIAQPLLRCYSDSSGFSFTTNIAPYCDYITGTEEIFGNNNIRISPNPAFQEINISLQSSKTSTADFIVRDVTGKEVMISAKHKIISGRQTIQIKLPRFNDGIYMMECRMKEGSVYRKMVISQN
ncbi:MAG: T9SS type A sorting domain-containing protein [Bacteroidia bacterium]